jgi:hypothetical protein
MAMVNVSSPGASIAVIVGPPPPSAQAQ